MKPLVTTTLFLLASYLSCSGASLYQSDLSSGVGWGTNSSSGDTSAIFGFNYGSLGIPEAPNNLGGVATTGLRMAANLFSGASQSLIVFPTGQNFTGNYTLRFDAWMSFDAEEYHEGFSEGTTEFLGGGIGYDNSASDIGPGAQFLATGDGGSGSDWRAFASGTFLQPDAMTAGSRNGFDPYYSDFLVGGVQPPPGLGQIVSGGSVAGSPGFQWLTWEITALNNNVQFHIEKPGGDRLEIITFDKTAVGSLANTDGNISLMYADFFSSVSPRPEFTFGLFDNVIVTGASVPETSSVPDATSTGFLALFGMGALAFLRKRWS